MGFAAVVAVSSIYTIDQQKKQADKQQKAAEKREELNQRRADVSSARSRAKQVRQARIARASALASGQSGAGTGGSGLAGAQANIAGNASRNISFLNVNQDISNQLTDLNISAGRDFAKSTGRISTAAGITKVASQGQDIFGA